MSIVAAGLLAEEAPITLLYVRPRDAVASELDAQLVSLVCRYAPLVALRVIEPEQLSIPNHVGLSTPALLVVRRGQVVGEALGAGLPARELDRVVRCAVEWPHGPE